jgi:hypothetical protein
MLTLENDAMTLRLSLDGRDLTLIDRRRGAVWHLDPGQQQFRRRQTDGVPGPVVAFPSGRVERLGDALRATYTAPDGVIQVCWELRVWLLNVFSGSRPRRTRSLINTPFQRGNLV